MNLEPLDLHANDWFKDFFRYESMPASGSEPKIVGSLSVSERARVLLDKAAIIDITKKIIYKKMFDLKTEY